MKKQSIGIFDSGIGGLTVAKAIAGELPNEDIIYFGDTANLPYGDKDAATIQGYSLAITDFLLQKNCKIILIACNSASAAAYDAVKEYVGIRAKVFNIIDPVIDLLEDNFTNKKIGLIGTKQTINSGIYGKKINERNLPIQLKSLATPLLVPAIEKCFVSNCRLHEFLEKYLAHETLQNIEGLILGCTHYPLIKTRIIEYYNGKIPILDAPAAIAVQLKQFLLQNGLLNRNGGSSEFYASQRSDSFANLVKELFAEKVQQA